MQGIYSDETVTARTEQTGMRRFLAIGDSLTEGYFRNGYSFHPYANRLNALFHENSINFEVTEHGISGETTRRISSRLMTYLKTEEKWDTVCILSGTNDLAYEFSVEEITAELNSMYTAVLDHQARLVCCTIPESLYKEVYYVTRRSGINQHIRQFAQANPSTTILVDLEKELPYFHHNAKDSRYWDDNLHMNAAGYDR